MYILGISAYYHDSAACLIYNNEIIAAVQEERFTRIKQDHAFPINSIKYCLNQANIEISNLEAIVYYEKPFLKFERLLSSYYHFAPAGLRSFLKAMPIWIKEKLLIKDEIKSQLKKIENFNPKRLKIKFSEHHLSHAASAYYPSGFESAAILCVDAVGEWASASIAEGKNGKLKILKELQYPNSLGLLYSAFTYFLGFVVNSGEYKLMGLAAYGIDNSETTKKYKKLIRENLVEIKEDGSIKLNMKFFGFATSLKMIKTKKWEKLFGIKIRKANQNINQNHCDLALAIQQITEEIVVNMAKEAKRITKEENLCFAGGVALNCVANSAILNSNIFKNIFIQPAAGDAGGALGAALAYAYLQKNASFSPSSFDKMKASLLGPEFSNAEIFKTLRKYKANYKFFENNEDLYEFTANMLNDAKVIGWFRGKMEFGPRALGNRSIIADARNAEMQKKLNLKIKFREGFRPFAPAVLAEDIEKYFDIKKSSPYMLFTAKVNENIRLKLPENYKELEVFPKLYTLRSSIPAVTHCDFSARIQSVDKQSNPDFYNLISKFNELTGTSLIINTSFNVRGEPIVCSPEDAFKCFMRTEMDILILENFVLLKENQNIENINLKEKFKLD